MATITIPRKEFEKNIKLTGDLAEKLMNAGISVDTINEKELILEITANRPDLLSIQGIYRHLKAYYGKETGLKEYKVEKPSKDFKVKVDKNLKEIRPFTACAIIKDLKFDDQKIKEIIDVQEKIHTTLGRNRKKIAIGIYPLEKITLPITFEARNPKDIKFRPLEVDREMNAPQILQSHPTGREYAHLLEGKDKFPVFVDAKGQILSMPPIINSHETGKVSENTKDIFIECSGFDFNTLKKTLNIIVTTFADMGGKIYSMELDYQGKKEITPDLEPEKMQIKVENFNKLIGLDITEKELEKLLARMGYNYNAKTKTALVPAWRTDVLHEVDMIEDAAIAYGYDNLIPEIPKVATIGEESQKEKVKSKIAEILIGVNMLEISTYHMIKEEEYKIVKLDEKEKIPLEDSKTEYKILRPNLIIPALRTLSENKDNEYPQRLFELGTCFELNHEGKEETGIKEPEKLCIALASNTSNFTEIKQVWDYLARMLNKTYEIEQAKQENPFMIEARTADITINNKTIGQLGELKPQVLESLGIKVPIAVLEINIEELC